MTVYLDTYNGKFETALGAVPELGILVMNEFDDLVAFDHIFQVHDASLFKQGMDT